MAKKKAARKRASAPNAAHIKELPDFVLEQVLGPSSRAKRRAQAAPAASRQRLRGGWKLWRKRVRPGPRGGRVDVTQGHGPGENAPRRYPRHHPRPAEQQGHRFHGAKINLAWFPWRRLASPCADKFGYLTPRAHAQRDQAAVRRGDDGAAGQARRADGRSGPRDARPTRRSPRASPTSVSSSTTTSRSTCRRALDVADRRNTINNMRTPALDLDSRLRRRSGARPVPLRLSRRRDRRPRSSCSWARNTNAGPGGPAGSAGTPAAMKVQVDFDVPRIHNPSIRRVDEHRRHRRSAQRREPDRRRSSTTRCCGSTTRWSTCCWSPASPATSSSRPSGS